MINFKRLACLGLTAVMTLGLAACDKGTDSSVASASTKSGETITLRVLENDTAKKEGYFEELLKAFNEAYADKGIVAVDADMDEYSDLAQNGPYGYGPDVLYQANDVLMKYAEDKHILPINREDYECSQYIPESAWDAFCISIDGTTYTCGIPVNIQEPMLFYRKDMLPANWESDWDDNKNSTPDFLENWNDLYAFSKYLRDTDESAGKDSQYGFMTSFTDLYLNGEFIFSYGGYVFGQNEDGTFNTADVGLAGGNAAKGLSAMKQFAGLMNEGCIDDTIVGTRYEKVANGNYFAAVSTPDTYVLFINKLALHYQEDGLSETEAMKKAEENLCMVELPAKLPKDGDLSRDAATMSDSDWVNTIVMGGVNGYGISSYTEHKEACIEFVNFATNFGCIKMRMDMLGIAPTRSDVAKVSGGTTELIFNSLADGRIYLMPSVKALNQVWSPAHTLMGDVAKDPYRAGLGEAEKYPDEAALRDALVDVSSSIYDSIYTMAN